jgi:hypothetical protein
MRWMLGTGLILLTLGATAAAGVDQRAGLNRFQADYPYAGLYYENTRITNVFGPAFGSGATPEQTAQQFVERYATMFGVPPEELIPGNHFNDVIAQPVMWQPEVGDFKFVLFYFAQHRAGIPVFNAELRLLVRNEPGYPLVLAVSTLRDLGDFQPDPALVASPFNRLERVAPRLTRFSEPQLVIYAGTDSQEHPPVLAVTFVADNFDDPAASRAERWRYVVDAATGQVLHAEDLIIFVDITGNVSGMATTIPKSDNCNPEVATAMPYAAVRIGSGTYYYADAQGNFTIPNSGSSPVVVESPMSGRYFTVTNAAGSTETLTQTVTPPGPANFMHNQANTDPLVRAQVNGYVQANVVRDFCLTYNPQYPTIYQQTGFTVRVNRTDLYCPGNAWYDGSSINFCQASGSYPNTAYSSVLHHEYGHHMVASGGSGQNEYGEGMSDSIAALIADDPILGYGFTGNCNQGIRTAENNCLYQTSGCSSCGSEIHACGQLLSGCIWDTRQELGITNPASALQIISNLTVNSILLHTGTAINPTITVHFLTLDDDDSNIYNGTPHYNEICTGFRNHNMVVSPVCDPLPAVVISFPDGLPASLLPGVPNTIRVQITNGSESYVPGSGRVYYRYDAGAFQSSALTPLGGNLYQATLPPTNCSANPQFYFSATGSGGTTVYSPANAPTGYYTAAMGTQIVVFADDMEIDRGWTVGDIGDNATTGIWDRNDPVGTAAQPEDDHTPPPGVKCWVTDSRGGAIGDYDVDNGKTTLKTPTLNLASHPHARISYWRWYSNDRGANPNTDTFVVDISNDNGTTWVNVETVGPSGPQTSGGWYYYEFRVADRITPTGQIKLRFVASDYAPGSIVEAAVDDFLVISFQCTDLYVPGDLNCDGLVNAFDIDPFVLALSNPAQYQQQYPDCNYMLADINADGQLNAFDIDPFVDLLTGL